MNFGNFYSGRGETGKDINNVFVSDYVQLFCRQRIGIVNGINTVAYNIINLSAPDKKSGSLVEKAQIFATKCRHFATLRWLFAIKHWLDVTKRWRYDLKCRLVVIKCQPFEAKLRLVIENSRLFVAKRWSNLIKRRRFAINFLCFLNFFRNKTIIK